jgi:hypothetical protein
MGTECPHLARVSNARPRKRSSLAESNRVRSFDISRAQAQPGVFNSMSTKCVHAPNNRAKAQLTAAVRPGSPRVCPCCNTCNTSFN